jgi:serine/threonine protein kinase
MALQPGTRLGPYEVLSVIGAGGMGEVYRARDTRLDRLVAVKVLAPELAGDAEFRARFTREAKTISALSHPHICGSYDIGRDHDTDYLVLELLDSETLAARLARVRLDTGTELAAGAPARLFPTNIQPDSSTPQYAVTADGQRFLGLEPVSEAANFTFLFNWLNDGSSTATRAVH